MRSQSLPGSIKRSLAICAVAAGGFLTFGFAAPLSAATYSIDDGTADKAVGFQGGPGDFIALNSFTIQSGSSLTVNSISIAFGSPLGQQDFRLNGYTFTAVLWDDPFHTGNPFNAHVLTTATGTVSNINTNTFVTVNLTPTQVLTQTFYVGFLISNVPEGTFPGALDTTSPISGRSYLAGGDAGTGNINNLGSNQLHDYIENFGANPGRGNWLIRANAIAAPDGATATGGLLVLSLAGLALFHRRFGGQRETAAVGV